jgi:carbon storage regulator
MSVLSRKVGETVFIGHSDAHDWHVTIEAIRGDKVRLGVWAPQQSTVHRLEVYQAIRRPLRPREKSGQTAATTTPTGWPDRACPARDHRVRRSWTSG